MEQIIITINDASEVKVEVKGVKGKSCKDLTKDFEAKLGRTVSDSNTGEYYEQPVIKNRV